MKSFSLLVRTSAVLVVLFAVALGTPTRATPGEAPFGDAVSARITNYNRASPYIGTAGLPQSGAFAELKHLGFVAVLDLRGAEEGTAEERSKVASEGLVYLNIPVTTKAPTWEQVEAFAAIIEDPHRYPILVHCHTANRVGAMWAMYRVFRDVDLEVAIEEGRAIGLTSREAAVRAAIASRP